MAAVRARQTLMEAVKRYGVRHPSVFEAIREVGVAEALFQDDCVSRAISELVAEGRDPKDPQTIAIAFAKCGMTAKMAEPGDWAAYAEKGTGILDSPLARLAVAAARDRTGWMSTLAGVEKGLRAALKGRRDLAISSYSDPKMADTIAAVTVMTSGPFVDEVDPDTGEPLSFHEWLDGDLGVMAENNQAAEASGQHTPTRPGLVPLVIEHSGVGAVGWAGNFRDDVDGVLTADFVDLHPVVEKAFRDKTLLGHSVEIARQAQSSNFREMPHPDGPIIKRIALLFDALPRVKTLSLRTMSEGSAVTIGKQYSSALGFARFHMAPSADASIVVYQETLPMPPDGLPHPDATPAPGGGGTTITAEMIASFITDNKDNPDKMDALAALLGGTDTNTEHPEDDPNKKPVEPNQEPKKKDDDDEKDKDKNKMSEAAVAAKFRLMEKNYSEMVGRLTKVETRGSDSQLKLTEKDLGIHYGEGVATDLMVIIKDRLGTTDLFSEEGEKRLAEIVTQETRHLTPLNGIPIAVTYDEGGKGGGTGGGKTPEDKIRNKILMDDPGQRDYLMSEDGKPTLEIMVKKRMEAAGVGA